jgi:hypothetical protein
MEADNRMGNYSSRGGKKFARQGLTGDLLYGMTPDEFGDEAKALAEASALNPATRERLKHQLIERLKTPVDPPSWGPDWVRRWNKSLHKAKAPSRGWFSRRDRSAPDVEAERPALNAEQRSDAQIIAQNLEKSRQVAQYRGLYVAGAVIAVAIALLAMFVDYEIIRGDIWTRALSNEFMIVPDSLKESVFFKSLQVVFAALAIHFMLKITGVYGRNTLISTAFVLTCVMVVCLGYLVAYNNMGSATSARFDHLHDSAAPSNNSIDTLLNKIDDKRASADTPIQPVAETTPVSVASASEFSLSVPKLSEQSLANADSWLWLAFASVIFFIVTTIAALYMQIAEHNVRNFLIARDYKTRRRQYAQLHLLELANA